MKGKELWNIRGLQYYKGGWSPYKEHRLIDYQDQEEDDEKLLDGGQYVQSKRSKLIESLLLAIPALFLFGFTLCVVQWSAQLRRQQEKGVAHCASDP